MIIIGITGSIAAYKSIDLAKMLIEDGYEIKIVLSKSATDFVSLLTLKSLFPEKVYTAEDSLNVNDEMLHISFAKAAKYIVIAPASANMISKLSNGAADCLLSSICLATQAPILIAPAMNKAMWLNKFVQNNVAKLPFIIGPSSGKQACGDDGIGRMVEPIEIVQYIKYFHIKKILEGKNILITAGPSIEKIDPVRFISNFSSGKMGYSIAKIASLMGANVTIISGPTNLSASKEINVINVKSGEEFYKACLKHAPNSNILIGAAAIADYIPQEYHPQKIKKTSSDMTLKLKKNIDVISSVKEQFKNLFVVGFAAETSNLLDYGTKKLKNKNLDMIAINDVSEGKVFGQDENSLEIITKEKKRHHIGTASKEEVAEKLLTIISETIN